MGYADEFQIGKHDAGTLVTIIQHDVDAGGHELFIERFGGFANGFAALEAERAGKYGLGFRVVAQEISRLADQTAVAALDIEGMVKEMQRSVKAGVDEMHSFSAQVHDGVQKISDISLKLGEIISAVQGISGRFGQVTDGMRAQSQGAEQIREAMVRLSAGAERTASSLNEFNVATTKLHTAVGELNGEVSRFTV